MTSSEKLDEIVERLLAAPRHKGSIANPTFLSKGKNRVCGDGVSIFVRVQDKKISEIKFQAAGCVLSKAAAALTAELAAGKPLEEVNQLQGQQILDELGAEIALRRSCALLPLFVLQQGLRAWQKEGNAVSEHMLA